DNLLNQKVFVGMLGKSKMNILVASNGQEALALLEDNDDIEIIFMDINMPVMDGYTATLHIRANSVYNNIAIVALTALTSVDEIDKMFNFGMNAYLSKPLKKGVLFSVLATFFKDTNSEIFYQEKEKEKQITHLKGLDIHIGIKKAASSEVFYREILLEFKDAYKDSPKILSKYLTDFRFEQLKILALDIKGLSGTIGAKELHDTATDIIKAIVLKDYDSIKSILKTYKTNLNIVIKSINQYNHIN
ncbi:MAG: response regulator, partial [Epsilonproteobacteria bacterium]|nr:response regulator [Campylobacterota bacterium]